MARLRSYRIFFMFFEAILGISATTHWVVTENGRIQPQLDSVFQMKRPYDLPAFLEQENRMSAVIALNQKIMARKLVLDSQIAVLNSIGDLESWLQSSNPECISSKKLLEDFDFYASVATDGSYRRGVKQKDYLLEGVPMEDIKQVPDCKKTFPLDFSMYTFEHLSAMRNRKNLSQHQEKGLIKYLPPGTDVDKFGHQVAHGLQKNNTSWLHLNLAAIYWRVKGDAYNALECARRAIVTAPREYRDIPLLTTGGILHAAKYSAEAAIVLHAAIDYAPTQSHQHLALGHVYAILGDYNRSVACYENSLRLTPTMEQARQAKFVIRCCQSLAEALTDLHKRLDDIVADLHAQQNDYAKWLKLEEKILCERTKTPFAAFRAQRLGPMFTTRGQTCMSREDDEAMLSCQVAADNQLFSRNLLVDIGVSLQQLKNVENQVEKINDRMTNSKVVPSVKSDISDKTLKISTDKIPESFTVFMEPTNKPKYYNFEIKKSKAEFEDKNWPDNADCEKLNLVLSDSKEHMQIYLPPENKGFATEIFVNELIGMAPDKEHSLPWYPPSCEPPETFDSKFITPLLLKATLTNSLPEGNLKALLTNLVKNAELAEIGQRILTATRSKVAAPWVLSMLASLHWRVVGKPRNALDCLQLALNTVPSRFKDVPLISIASIAHKVGLIDEAFKAAKEALAVNSIEPLTNILYGMLLHAKGNNTGAIHHLKQSLRVDTNAYSGKALILLKTVICRKRLAKERRAGSGGGNNGIETCGLTYTSPEIIDKHDLNYGETVLCLGDGSDCKPIQCFAMKVNTDKTADSIKKLPNVAPLKMSLKKGGLLNLDSATLNEMLSNRRVECTKAEQSSSLANLILNANVDGNAEEFILHSLEEFEKNTLLMSVSLDENAKNPAVSQILDSLYVSVTEMGSNVAFLAVHDKAGIFSLSPKECKDTNSSEPKTPSVWYLITARGLDVSKDTKPIPTNIQQQPICDGGDPGHRYMAHMDLLSRKLPKKPEPDAADELHLLMGDPVSSIQQLGTKVARALRKNTMSWTLAMAASLYWRVEGDSRKAIDCIRQALVFAPKELQDVPLINLATLLHGQGFHQPALHVAQLALIAGPDCAVNHFIVANFHATLGEFEEAVNFYRSSLALDPTFKPALKRLQAILCWLLFDESTPTLQKMIGKD